MATVLVQNGTLRAGDTIVAGTTVGRVRSMMDDRGRRVKEAGPSVPVEITGLNDVPVGGDIFNAVSDERLARELVEQRLTEQKEAQFNSQTKVTLDNLFEQMKEGDMKELKIIVKATCRLCGGRAPVLGEAFQRRSAGAHHPRGGGRHQRKRRYAGQRLQRHYCGFNVRPDPVAEENAKRDGVDMRLYRIIYDCIEEIESA